MVFAIVNIPVYYLAYYGLQIDSVASFIGITAAPFLITVAVGAALFLFPSLVSNRIVSSCEEASCENKNNELEIVGLSVIGAYIVAVGVGDLIYLASLYGLAQEVVGTHFTPDRWADLTASLSEFAFGLLLVLRSSVIVKYACRFRASGNKSSNKANSADAKIRRG